MEWVKTIDMDSTTLGLLDMAKGDREEGFYCQWRAHKKLDELTKAMVDWAEQRVAHINEGAEVRKIREEKYAQLAFTTWPNVRDTRRAATLFKLMYWIFLFDDVLDDSGSLRRNSEQVTHFCVELLNKILGRVSNCQPRNFTSPKELLLVDLGQEWWGEIQSDNSVSKTQLLNFESIVSRHILPQGAFTRLSELMDEDKLPSLEEYILVRKGAFGTPLLFLGTEFELEMEVGDVTFNDQRLLRQLQDAVTSHVCWTNDLLSFPKEHALENHLNLLPLLHIHNNTSAQQAGLPFVPFHVAVSQALDMANAAEEQCERLALLILSNDHPGASQGLISQQQSPITDYVKALCGYIPANRNWTLRNQRYSYKAANTTAPPSQPAHSNNYMDIIIQPMPSFPLWDKPRSRMIVSHVGSTLQGLALQPSLSPLASISTHPPSRSPKGIQCLQLQVGASFTLERGAIFSNPFALL